MKQIKSALHANVFVQTTVYSQVCKSDSYLTLGCSSCHNMSMLFLSSFQFWTQLVCNKLRTLYTMHESIFL